MQFSRTAYATRLTAYAIRPIYPAYGVCGHFIYLVNILDMLLDIGKIDTDGDNADDYFLPTIKMKTTLSMPFAAPQLQDGEVLLIR